MIDTTLDGRATTYTAGTGIDMFQSFLSWNWYLKPIRRATLVARPANDW